jgi:glycosyltransferase involved in cell wall biosynthesis
VNWVFVDNVDWDYDVATPLERPLGGSQSALCYLATALAARGHTVTTLTGTKSPRFVAGVQCLSHRTLAPEIFDGRDTVIVAINDPPAADDLRRLLRHRALLILWMQAGHDQPMTQRLLDPACSVLWDQVVCVSEWHRTMLRQHLHLPLNQLSALGNGVSPAFERLFLDRDEVAQAKSRDPRLAYTSIPYRGLDVLANCFPEIRRRHPQCRLDVYSSMQVYGGAGVEDKHQLLYDLCRATEGIDYRGSVPQRQLAEELRGAHVLAYPNTFAETSCIAAMEALAAGCLVITSELGALPETCSGWGKLVPPIAPGRSRKQYAREFVDAVDAALVRMQLDWPAFVADRYQQIQAINATCTWKVRAAEWETAAARWLAATPAS